MRWQSPTDENYPDKPTVKVGAFNEIAANLPPDHPTVTEEERAEILHERYLAANKRRNPTGQFDETAASSRGSSGGCTVGGSLETNPAVRINHRLLGSPNATELATIMATVGLAQNFAALRALSTDGIQQGHMTLHARSVASTARPAAQATGLAP